MEKQIIKIEIESSGEYDFEKTFKKVVQLDERQFIALTTSILDFLDKEKIGSYASPKVPKN